MEILAGILLILLGIVAFKLIIWVIKAGFFLITLPIKIALGAVFGLIFVLLIPVFIIPAALGVAVILPIILIAAGIGLIIKFAI